MCYLAQPVLKVPVIHPLFIVAYTWISVPCIWRWFACTRITKKKESAFICACSSLEPGRGLVLMCIVTDMVYECLDAV